MLTEDITLYAQWTEVAAPVEEFTVIFESNGGSAVDSQTVVSGEMASEPTEPTKPTDSTVQAESTESAKSTGSTAQSSPQTGDDSNIALWSTLLLSSLAMIGSLSWIAFKKREKNC